MSDLMSRPGFGVEESIDSYCSAEGPSNERSSSNSPNGDEKHVIVTPKALCPSNIDSFECQCNDCSGGKISQIYDDVEETPDLRTVSEKKPTVVTSYYNHHKIADGSLVDSNDCCPAWLVPSESEVRNPIGKPSSFRSSDFERGCRSSPNAGRNILGPIIKSSVATSEVTSEDCTSINQECRTINGSRKAENSDPTFCCSTRYETKSVVPAPYVMAVHESLEFCQSAENSCCRTRRKYNTPKIQESSSSETSHGASSDLLELISGSSSRIVEIESLNSTQPKIIVPSENFRASECNTHTFISPSIVASSSTSATCTCALLDQPCMSKESEIFGPTISNSSCSKRTRSIWNGDFGIVCRTGDLKELASVPKEGNSPVLEGLGDISTLPNSISKITLKESSESCLGRGANRRKLCSEPSYKSDGFLTKIEPSSIQNSKEEQLTTSIKAEKSTPTVMEAYESLGSSVSAKTLRSAETSAGKPITLSIQQSSTSEISHGASKISELISRSTSQKEESKKLGAARPRIVISEQFSGTSQACSSGSAVTSSSTSAACTCVPQDKSTYTMKESEIRLTSSNLTSSKRTRSNLDSKEASGSLYQNDGSKEVSGSPYQKDGSNEISGSLYQKDGSKEASGSLYQKDGSKEVSGSPYQKDGLKSKPSDPQESSTVNDSGGIPDLQHSVSSITLKGGSESLIKLSGNQSEALQNNDGALSKPLSSQTLRKVQSVQSSISGKVPHSLASKSNISPSTSINQSENLDLPSGSGTGKKLMIEESNTSGPQDEKRNQAQKWPSVCRQNFGKSTPSKTTMQNVIESSKSDTPGRSLPRTPSSKNTSDSSSSLRAPETAIASKEYGSNAMNTLESQREITQSSVSQYPSKVLSGTGTISDSKVPSVREDSSQLTTLSSPCDLTSDDEKSSSYANKKLEILGTKSSTNALSSNQNLQGISSKSDCPISISPLASFTTSRKFKDELELSTLLSVAYVRVRDLTNAIDRAREFSSNMDKEEKDDLEDELRAKIETMFESRANLSLERARWRCEFSSHYRQRRQILADLKTQSDDLVDKNLELRQQVNNLAEEPTVVKPKKNLLKKLFSCGLVN